jgi:hypothetical protein
MEYTQKYMEDESKISILNIPASKLLHYAKAAELKDFYGVENYINLETLLYQQTGQKPTLPDMKKALLRNVEFINRLRGSQLGQTAFQRYKAASDRLKGLDRTSIAVARPELSQARRGFIGCVSSKVPTEVFESCLEEYEDPAYQDVSLVPTGALKQKVWVNTTDPAVKAALGPSVEGKVFSSIPQGLRHLMLSRPNEFRQLMADARIQANIVKSIIKSMTPAEKEKLKTLYSAQGSVPRGEVERILASTSSSSRALGNKRVRTVLNQEEKKLVEGRGTKGITGGTNGGNIMDEPVDDDLFDDMDLEALQFDNMLRIQQEKRAAERATDIPASFD